MDDSSTPTLTQPDFISCSNIHSGYLQALQKWSNFSNIWHNNSAYFKSYVCLHVQYEEIKETWESVEARFVFVLGLFGLFGSILSTVTFFKRPFVPADVYLYRMVGLVETVHMTVMSLANGLSVYTNCASDYFCMIFSAHFYITIINGCADAVEFVVVFLCLERTIACLIPHHFHLIHRLSTYRLIVILSIFSSLPINIVHSFDVRVVKTTVENSNEIWRENDRYREEISNFADTWLYSGIMDIQLIRFCVFAPLIIVSTAGSIFGLYKAAKRKRRLRGDFPKSPHCKTLARSRKDIKSMIDLCCLQLCLAIPIVINYLLCVVERICNSDLPDRNKLWEEIILGKTNYDGARSIILRCTMLEYLRLSISLTHMLAHGLHFYLYLLFSTKFRKTLGEFLRLRERANFTGMGHRWSRDREPFVTMGAASTGFERLRIIGLDTRHELTSQPRWSEIG